jgi:hypothetical protein
MVIGATAVTVWSPAAGAHPLLVLRSRKVCVVALREREEGEARLVDGADGETVLAADWRPRRIGRESGRAVWDWRSGRGVGLGQRGAERGEEEGTGSGGRLVRMGDCGGSVEQWISGAGGPRTAATDPGGSDGRRITGTSETNDVGSYKGGIRGGG